MMTGVFWAILSTVVNRDIPEKLPCFSLEKSGITTRPVRPGYAQKKPPAEAFSIKQF